MEGMDRITANLHALRARLMQQAEAAADESGHLLTSYAKDIAPWTDRTGLLRQTIAHKNEVTTAHAQIWIFHSRTYAPFVEAGGAFSKRNTTRMSTRKGKITAQRISDRAFGTIANAYPSLWPSVADNSHRVVAIFRKHMAL